MTTDEERVSMWLHDTTPHPPRALVLEDIAARVEHAITRARSRRMLLAPLAAVAAVAVVVAITVAVDGQHSNRAPAAAHTGPVVSSSPRPSASISAPNQKIDTPWGGTLVAGPARHATPILSDGGYLYAATDHELFRIDAETQQITAQTATTGVGYLSDAVMAGGSLWVSPMSDSRGHAVLTGYDPVTLEPNATLTLPSDLRSQLLTMPIAVGSRGGGARLYLAIGNTIEVIDAAARRIVDQIPATGGQLVDIAISADSTQIYAAIDRAASEVGRVEVFNASDGRALQTVEVGGPIVNNIGLVSTAGGLWVHSGGGMADHIEFLAGDALSPETPSEYGQVQGRPLTITVSGGTVWIGATSIAACADPNTARERDSMALPAQHGSTSYLNDLQAAAGHLYGSYNQPNESDGPVLVQLTPPTQCRG